MNGLDKIIAQILDDAKQESLAIQEKAAGEAEATLAAAGKKAGGRAGEIGGAA